MTTTLRIARGDRGEAVRDLKVRLAELGFDPGRNEALEEFGPDTEASVRAFQSARGLRIDGVCGSQTWSALVESGYVPGDRLLYQRQPMLRGDDVASLQRGLNALGFDAGREDGILGPDTDRAVRDFQRNAGVTVDGIAGPETLVALDRVARDLDGSVRVARERDALRDEPRVLTGRRIFLAAEPSLMALAEGLRHGLAGASAEVVLETASDDQSALAAEANRFEAELVVLLRLGDAAGCGAAFYQSGNYRSERGLRLAQCMLDALGPVVAGPAHDPEGKTFDILRETRAPAVVVEPAPAGDVVAARRLISRGPEVAGALLAGLRRAVEQPVEDAS